MSMESRGHTDTLHHTFNSGPSDDDASVIKNEDLFDPKSLEPGQLPRINEDTQFIVSDPDTSDKPILEVGLEGRIKDMIIDIESTGLVDSAGLESLRGYIPPGVLMDSSCYMPGRSRLHARHTLAQLRSLLK